MSSTLDKHVDETTKRTALIAAVASSFVSPFMVSAINIALPAIALEFRMNAVLLTFVPMAYILSGAIFLLPLGRIADIYGRKRLFAWGAAMFAASSILCGFARSGEMLIVLRAFQGVGGAMLFGIGVAILISAFPASDRGKVLGLAVAAVYVGLSVGPLLGGFMTEQLGWRSIFFFTGILGAAITVSVLWKLKGEWAEARGESFDIIGAAVYCLTVGAVMYGSHLLPGRAGILFLALGLAGLCLFLKWETRVEFPVLDWKLFRHNRVFLLSNLAMFINYGATYAIGFLISLYLQYNKHLSPQSAGLILMAQPVVQAAFLPLCRQVIRQDRAPDSRVLRHGHHRLRARALRLPGGDDAALVRRRHPWPSTALGLPCFHRPTRMRSWAPWKRGFTGWRRGSPPRCASWAIRSASAR